MEIANSGPSPSKFEVVSCAQGHEHPYRVQWESKLRGQVRQPCMVSGTCASLGLGSLRGLSVSILAL